MDIVWLIVGATALFVAVVCTYKIMKWRERVRAEFLNRTLEEAQAKNKDQEELLGRITAELNQTKIEKARLEELQSATQRHVQEKIALLDHTKEKLSEHFKSLAHEIMKSHTREFSTGNKESLMQLLTPFREQIDNFQKDVRNSHDKFIQGNTELRVQLTNLAEQTMQISQDAVNLTNALKSEPQTRGAWGEITLRRVLEMSGLTEGREYVMQKTLKDDENKSARPDCIINLPDNRSIVIDSKLSLVAYSKISMQSPNEEINRLLDEHVNSMRTHIKQLDARNYQSLPGIKTLNFVVMFVPIEGALAAAQQHRVEITQEAIKKKIILVSPNTLMGMLLTIENMWREDKQNKNAREIAAEAGKMYDKFCGFMTELGNVGGALKKSQESYDKVVKKLSTGRGNLVDHAQKIQKLGARSQKELPDIPGAHILNLEENEEPDRHERHEQNEKQGEPPSASDADTFLIE